MEDIDYGKMIAQAKMLAGLLQEQGTSDGDAAKSKDGDTGQMDMEKMMNLLHTMRIIQSKTNTPDTWSCNMNMQSTQPMPEKASDIPREETAEIPEKETPQIPHISAQRTEQPTPEMGIQAMKAAIPYLERQYQKKMWLFIKTIEIHKLLDIYGQKMTIAAASGQINWQREILAAAKPHMTPENSAMIDLILKCMEIKEIMNVMEGARNG